ncbi:class I mannose-6-phosphate isomerase [Novosphingobium sp. B1]|uniref:class I mannose-6-phosphate isomerase n=1 Tax=Novosphingobium sp. B1 TaxID=1938756 RepID=UPI0009FDE2E9|nr:class I mannose-6-phosphate isomerase [Novosphingobium sp. B1]
MLPKRMVEKPWGKDVLPAPFTAPEGQRIGEIWFEPPPEMPDILVKYIFTSEKLSVQVHPSDAQARELGESDRGKEECWLVLDAEPGATLGIGFKAPIDAKRMREAALDGTIEDLMEWHPVQRGDCFYIPAGTVHAIGAGITLVEIQQNSDITYRLYDYGRPRELHLDKGVAVAEGDVTAGIRRKVELDKPPADCVVSGRFFTVDLVGEEGEAHGPVLVLPLAGNLEFGEVEVEPGDCAWLAEGQAITAGSDGAALCIMNALMPV